MNHDNPQAQARFKQLYPHEFNYLLHNIPAAEHECQPCVMCITGKAKRVPFPTASAAPRKPLDAVPTDTTVPINPPDADGNRYLHILGEAATGHTTEIKMKAKSDASEAIMSTINKLQLALGETFKPYPVDNFREQHTQVLVDALPSQGTAITTISSHSSRSNALRETRFRIIFNAVRTALKESVLPHTLWPVCALDFIVKLNFLLIKLPEEKYRSPNAFIYPQATPTHFFPFGQRGHIIDTTPHKVKLRDRAIPARYLRAPTQAQYLVLLPQNNTTWPIRPAKFVLNDPQ